MYQMQKKKVNDNSRLLRHCSTSSRFSQLYQIFNPAFPHTRGNTHTKSEI